MKSVCYFIILLFISVYNQPELPWTSRVHVEGSSRTLSRVDVRRSRWGCRSVVQEGPPTWWTHPRSSESCCGSTILGRGCDTTPIISTRLLSSIEIFRDFFICRSIMNTLVVILNEKTKAFLKKLKQNFCRSFQLVVFIYNIQESDFLEILKKIYIMKSRQAAFHHFKRKAEVSWRNNYTFIYRQSPVYTVSLQERVYTNTLYFCTSSQKLRLFSIISPRYLMNCRNWWHSSSFPNDIRRPATSRLLEFQRLFKS